MRIIKFRAYSKRGKKMFQVKDMTCFGDGKVNVFVDGNKDIANSENTLFSHEFELMQSTGLVDKLGKEIYEGDIFGHRTLEDGKMNTIKGEVIWNDRLGQWEVGEGLMLWALRDDAEVIGNVWENPELLQK